MEKEKEGEGGWEMKEKLNHIGMNIDWWQVAYGTVPRVPTGQKRPYTEDFLLLKVSEICY